jgi:S-DNA-T family DNA segregation ATPase FtsK/SpoIIIE
VQPGSLPGGVIKTDAPAIKRGATARADTPGGSKVPAESAVAYAPPLALSARPERAESGRCKLMTRALEEEVPRVFRRRPCGCQAGGTIRIRRTPACLARLRACRRSRVAMQAESVLIDRIPGKSTVGIQIPNPNREQISMRELLESEAYRRSTSRLTLALGKTIHGEPFVSDLATMPHLLIAGSTGTGKSVSVNAMLSSILFRATPEDVRLIMIDPKRLELGMYEEIPHLLTPWWSIPGRQRPALGRREMEERYKTLAAGRPQHQQFNRNIGTRGGGERPGRRGARAAPAVHRCRHRRTRGPDDGGEQRGRGVDRAPGADGARRRHPPDPGNPAAVGRRRHGSHQGQPPGPRVVPADVEGRLADHPRRQRRGAAAGARRHAVPAAGLVSADPSAWTVHLRTGKRAARGFLRKQGKPTYDETITAEEKASAGDLEFEKDDLYDEAARIVVGSGQASISYLQRRLRIGFSRAARLVDMMEAEGLVSPGAGGKAREVLVKKDYFEEVDAQLR